MKTNIHVFNFPHQHNAVVFVQYLVGHSGPI